MSERKTLAGAYEKAGDALQKIDSHEQVCAERYQNINDSLGDVKAAVKSHQKIAWGIVISLLAWMGIQMWTGQQERIAQLERPALLDVPGS